MSSVVKLVGMICIANHPSGRSKHWNKERLYTTLLIYIVIRRLNTNTR